MILEILISVLIVSLISLVGVVYLFFKNVNEKILVAFISFASGALLAGAFLELLPESVESVKYTYWIFLAGILLFFILEKFLHWHHCHNCRGQDHKIKPLAYINFIGDGVHNFIDGVTITIAYLASFQLGVATTVAIMIHEIPQELSDFAILLYSGLSKSKALLFNLLTALVAVVGAIIAYFVSKYINLNFLLPVAAAGFTYIALSDLIPELHKKVNIKFSMFDFILIILGILVMYGLEMLI